MRGRKRILGQPAAAPGTVESEGTRFYRLWRSPIFSRPLLLAWLLFAAWSVAPLWAQSGAQIKMELDHLDARADEVVSVNLEGKALEGGSKILALRKGVTEPVKKLLAGLKGIYMRRFWFGRKKAYTAEDIDPILQQMRGPGWVPVIEVEKPAQDGSGFRLLLCRE